MEQSDIWMIYSFEFPTFTYLLILWVKIDSDHALDEKNDNLASYSFALWALVCQRLGA